MMSKKSRLLIASLAAMAIAGCTEEKPSPEPTPTPPPTPPVAPSIVSLCNPSEQILFNCRVDSEGKTLSVCASQDMGYMQYRYGVDTNSIEMIFPSSLDNTLSKFQYRSGMLSFKNSTVTYQVSAMGVQTSWAKSPERNRMLGCSGEVENNLSRLTGVLQ